MSQEEGLVGRLVGGMIRRSVRQCFRRVYWRPPSVPLQGPVVFAVNHTGWHDGYLMFLAVSRLQVRSLDWIAEFDAFPLFRKVGGLPFPPGDAARRTATIRETLRLIREEGRSLIVFADGTLRRPGEPWEVGRAVELAAGCRPGVQVVPVSIVYDMSIHQRPEAFLSFGAPIDPADFSEKGQLCREAKSRIEALTYESQRMFGQESCWEVLHNCLLDVNERFDMRKAPLQPPH